MKKVTVVEVGLSDADIALLAPAGEALGLRLSAFLRTAALERAGTVQVRRVSTREEQAAEALELHRLGWSYAEIGRRLGIAPDTVKVRLAQARRGSAVAA